MVTGSATDCIKCTLIDNHISMFFWWTSAVPLTVDTVQYVTEYNNSELKACENTAQF